MDVTIEDSNFNENNLPFSTCFFNSSIFLACMDDEYIRSI
jgi:hypothetical protein